MSAPLRKPPIDWTGPSSDPNDEQLGDVTEQIGIEKATDRTAMFVGEPTDRAVIGRKGAREGPRALREALAGTKTHQFDRGPIDALGDLGDVAFESTHSVTDRQELAAEVATTLYDSETRPVFLGGDNSMTVGNVRPLLERGSVGVISLDAHLDSRAGAPSSGTPYRQLFEAGLDTYAVVGARSFENSTAYAEYAREHGTVVTAESIRQDLAGAIERVESAMADVEQLFLSVDLDVVTAAAAPGVSAPTPGGISTRELFALVERFATMDRLAGVEVVECAPALDAGDRTAIVGARAIAHVVSQWSSGETQ